VERSPAFTDAVGPQHPESNDMISMQVPIALSYSALSPETLILAPTVLRTRHEPSQWLEVPAETVGAR